MFHVFGDIENVAVQHVLHTKEKIERNIKQIIAIFEKRIGT